jgi:hypothetical protein
MFSVMNPGSKLQVRMDFLEKELGFYCFFLWGIHSNTIPRKNKPFFARICVYGRIFAK